MDELRFRTCIAGLHTVRNIEANVKVAGQNERRTADFAMSRLSSCSGHSRAARLVLAHECCGLELVTETARITKMREDEVPGDVRKFLYEHIESYEQLEVLLLLQRECSDAWTAEHLSLRLKISPSLVAAALSWLQARRIVEASPDPSARHYTLVSGQPTLEATVNRLASVYAARTIDVIKLMSANAIERVRTAALRTFVNAFVIQRDKNNG